AYTSLLPFVLLLFLLALRPPPHSTLFPYTTLFRSHPCWERDRHQLVTQADTLNPLHTDLRRQNLVLVGYVDRHIHIGRSAVHRGHHEVDLFISPVDGGGDERDIGPVADRPPLRQSPLHTARVNVRSRQRVEVAGLAASVTRKRQIQSHEPLQLERGISTPVDRLRQRG